MKLLTGWIAAELFSVIIGLTGGSSTAPLLAGAQVLRHKPLDAGVRCRSRRPTS
ncbi:hypothetical protein [Thiomonas bhubaneswarensis]|uniref:hypothetical protein n=1 Tax=Thiomonas bhubaneswarensis TaxID=339866 RepID=UPI000AFE649E|nr:hypothetical protein [Thiomonas bhubaneswarensis]